MNKDFDRDRHEHNGRWFERVAPHSPHYVQCLPDGVTPTKQTKGNMMDAKQMSNDELIDAYWHGGCDHACDHVRVAHEMQSRLRTAMHWLPMTPDAVFEDAKDYLIQYNYGAYGACDGGWIKSQKESITHYARITEPK